MTKKQLEEIIVDLEGVIDSLMQEYDAPAVEVPQHGIGIAADGTIAGEVHLADADKDYTMPIAPINILNTEITFDARDAKENADGTPHVPGIEYNFEF